MMTPGVEALIQSCRKQNTDLARVSLQDANALVQMGVATIEHSETVVIPYCCARIEVIVRVNHDLLQSNA